MRSLRAQLTASLLCTVLGLAGACGFGFYAWSRHTLMSRFDAALIAKAQALGALVQWDGSHLEVSPAEGLMPEFGSVQRPEYFLIRHDDGSVVARSPSLRGADLPASAFASMSPLLESRTLPDGRPGREVVIRFRPAIEVEANAASGEISRSNPRPLTLVLAKDQSELIQLLATLRWSLLGAGIVMAAGIVLAVTYVVRNRLQPLLRLAHQVRLIDAASLSTRMDDEMPLELRPIRDRVNELLSRLQNAFERERRFTSDAAHELRTPIAELWAVAEIGQGRATDAASVRESFQDALSIARQMDGLVTTLLALARAESGTPKVATAPIDLNAIVRQTWGPLAPRALARQLDVAWEMPAALAAHGDQELLMLVIRNLLHNAVDHSPLRGELVIAAHARHYLVELSITNSNSTLTPADLCHLGEAFWRKEESRTDQTHHGLGLSLALAYSRMMRLTLRFELPEPKRFRAVLSLPTC